MPRKINSDGLDIPVVLAARLADGERTGHEDLMSIIIHTVCRRVSDGCQVARGTLAVHRAGGSVRQLAEDCAAWLGEISDFSPDFAKHIEASIYEVASEDLAAKLAGDGGIPFRRNRRKT